jgi:uncharacterized tellurite resistance protein B-like protein
MGKKNLFNRLLKSLSEDEGFVSSSGGGSIQLTPYLSLIVAILYMMAADDEISEQECNQLLSVFGDDQQILQRGLIYIESKTVDEFLAEMPQQVDGDDGLCILLNVCDCSMADGDFSKSEMILFSRMLSSLGHDKNSFKPYFDTISLKHKHSVFGANTDTAGGEMTPVRALVVSMLYMMSVDGEMAKEEIGQINVALRGSKNLLPEALKYVKRTKFSDFMSEVSSTLNHQQKLCILVNVVDIMLSDGHVDRLEQDLFRRMLAGFDISDANFKKHYSNLTIKNERPVDIRAASKSGKKGEVVRNTINTDEQKQFAAAGTSAVNENVKASPASAPAGKISNEIVNKLEKNVDSFESQAKSAGGMDLMAANARASENSSNSDATASPEKKTPSEPDKNQVKKSANTSAPDISASQTADAPKDDRKLKLPDAQGMSDIRNLRDAEGGELDTRSLRDAEGGESDTRRLRDAEGGESDTRRLRDAEDGESDTRRLKDAQGASDIRNLRDAESGLSDTRGLRDAKGDSDIRRQRDAEGDSDIRSSRDADGDSDMRRLRDADGEAETRQLKDGEGDSDKRQISKGQSGIKKHHLRDAEGESDLRKTSDGDGDVDFRKSEDANTGAKSPHLRDATAGGGKKLNDSDSDNEVIALRDDQGANDPELQLNARMGYLKSWTGSLNDNLDEFESIDVRHTNKRAVALEMVTIRPDRPAALTLSLVKPSIQTTTQSQVNDIVLTPLARNFDMTERQQQIATESVTAPVVDKTRKVLAALTTGLIITQGFSSFGLSEAQNTFMTNQLMSSTTHMSVETLTVQQSAFNLTADLMDHIVSKNEGYSGDLRELSKTSAETYRTQAQKIESGADGNESKTSLKAKIKVYENQSAIQLLKLKWFGLANGILMLGFFLSFFGLLFKSKMSVGGSSVVFVLGTLVTLNGFFLFI